MRLLSLLALALCANAADPSWYTDATVAWTTATEVISDASCSTTLQQSDTMSGLALNVEMPVDPPFVSYNETLTGNARFTGYYAEALSTIATSAGFTYTITKPDSYSAGVVSTIDYATTGIDMFWGAYFITTDRAKATDYTVPMSEGGLAIIVLSTDSGMSWDDKIWVWTKPFEDRVWYVLVAMFIFASIVFWFLERGNGYFGEQRKRDGAKNGEGGLGCSLATLPQNICTSFQMSVSSYYGSAPKPSSAMAKGFGVFYHLFVFFVVAAYIANLAAYIVSLNAAVSASSGSIASITDAVSQSVPVCVPSGGSIETLTATNYPSLSTVSWSGTLEDGVEKLRAGDCSALVYDYDLLVYQTTKTGYCDISIAGGIFLKIPYAAGFARNAAKSGLARQMSVQISTQREANLFTDLYTTWIDTGNSCESSSASVYKVDVHHFFVPLIVAVIVAFITSAASVFTQKNAGDGHAHDEHPANPTTHHAHDEGLQQTSAPGGKGQATAHANPTVQMNDSALSV